MTPPLPSYQGIGLKTGIRPIAEINTNTNTNNDDDDNNDDSNNNNDTNTNTNTNIKIKTKNRTSRTIRISEELYKKFSDHSRRYYNTEPYETIIENLLKCYDEHNKDKYWFNNGNNNN